jgi:hypothetical protein
MERWLFDESQSIDVQSMEASIPKTALRMRGQPPPPLAIRINDLIVHDTQKWFNSADIRLDCMVVYGQQNDEAQDYYSASTFRFGGIKDNDRLPIERPGQRIFYGHPSSFLDVSIFVSRDTRDSDELSAAIDREMNTDVWQGAASAVLTAVPGATAAAIVGGIGGAAAIANATYKILKNVTGNTIGLYRTSWLQYRDRFGLGRHPEQGSFRQQDFSFWYEIELDMEDDTS